MKLESRLTVLEKRLERRNAKQPLFLAIGENDSIIFEDEKILKPEVKIFSEFQSECAEGIRERFPQRFNEITYFTVIPNKE